MVYLRTKVLPITMETTRANAERWLKLAKHGESGTVVQFQDDSEYRVAEIVKNRTLLREVLGPYYRRFILLSVSIGRDGLISQINKEILAVVNKRKIVNLDSKDDIENICNKLVDRGYSILVFVYGFSNINYEELYDELRALEEFLRSAHNVSIVLFSDRNIMSEKYSNLVDKCSLFFDHIELYSLYSSDDSWQFIKYNESMWRISLGKELNEKIIHVCGGYLWLISHIQRKYRDNPDFVWEDLEEDRGLLLKLQAILGKLSLDERKILDKVNSGAMITKELEENNFSYLAAVGLVKIIDKKVVLGIPLLSIALKNSIDSREIQILDRELYIGGNKVKSSLSIGDLNILHTLMSESGKLVDRKLLARVLWSESAEEKYSDWAIDRRISRLRAKLKEIGINSDLIKTVKGRGYVWD